MSKEIMVKVCSKCGIINSEKAEECESCGAGLDAPVKNRKANKLSKRITKRNEKIRKAIADEKFSAPEEEPVDIPVTPARIVLGVIGCLAAVCEVVIMVLSGRICPEFSYEVFMLGICTLMLLAIAVLHCFLPGKMWMLNHCFDWIYYKETPKPSDTGLKLQVVGCALLILLSAAFIGGQLALIFGLL